VAPAPPSGGEDGRLGPVEGREWVYWAQTIPVD
jgi:hypothetical protein